ncbi:ABC transporter substrate-binding protein [Mesorhizobium sp.]|uniref:ABC transporter substrate-binding protein n=1 Tax=Mesorhizobium sp. TaxID=1871066 RepID=UPI000FE69880|nr:ABC transporter substrate-binding protein [Mesorhizobium sp.]RWC27917.1 MAG: extracellular solute-binding protein [Mesorhizobium sp.]TIX27695.1 MAG: extracellular solute-binding protein [Mesorhizobium sp.]
MRTNPISTLLSAAAILLAAQVAHAGDITLVGAGGVLQDAERAVFFEPFAKEAGVTFSEDSYAGEQAKIRAMVLSKNVTWDVVQLDHAEMIVGCDEGLYQKLDWSKIGNPEDFLPQAVQPCGVGAFAWSFIFAYDQDRIADGPKNWVDFWDLKKWPGKRGMRASARLTLEAALLADGVKNEDLYKVLATDDGVARAFKKLDEIKSQIVWWSTGAESIERLAASDVAVTTAFNGRVTTANQNGRHFALVWDGQMYGQDYWGIVSGSPHKDLAEKFLTFASRPEIQSKLPEKIAYGIMNKKAIAMVSPKAAEAMPTAPQNLKNAIPFDAAFWAENDADLTAKFEAWRAR